MLLPAWNEAYNATKFVMHYLFDVNIEIFNDGNRLCSECFVQLKYVDVA